MNQLTEDPRAAFDQQIELGKLTSSHATPPLPQTPWWSLGMFADGTTVRCGLPDRAPQALLVGAVGKGKTTTLRRLVEGISRIDGAHLYPVTTNPTFLAGLESLAGVEAPVWEPSEIQARIETVHTLIQERYEALRAGTTTRTDLTPAVLIVDEMTDTWALLDDDPAVDASGMRALYREIVELGDRVNVGTVCTSRTVDDELARLSAQFTVIVVFAGLDRDKEAALLGLPCTWAREQARPGTAWVALDGQRPRYAYLYPDASLLDPTAAAQAVLASRSPRRDSPQPDPVDVPQNHATTQLKDYLAAIGTYLTKHPAITKVDPQIAGTDPCTIYAVTTDGAPIAISIESI